MKTNNDKKKFAKIQKAKEIVEREKKYNRAKTWQLVLYPAGAIGQNSFMILMVLVSYYAAGIVGLGTVLASFVITGSRIFDSITDPLVGFVIDRTNGKFGKVRPFLVLGYLIMSLSTTIMFYTAHQVPEGMRLIYFIFLYAVYIVGYTFAGVAKWSGLAVITNDPKQRPILGGMQTAYMAIVSTFVSMYASLYLIPKYGGFNNANLFQEFVLTVVVIAGILYTMCIAAIWSKDQIENYSIGQSEKTSVKDMWKVIKGNRALQLFIVSATSDKLALQIHSNQVVVVMLYGIIIGSYAMYGHMAIPTLIVNLLMIFFGISHARKVGTKKGYVLATWGCLVTYILLFSLLWLGDAAQIGFDNWGFMTIAFLGLMLLGSALIMLCSGLVPPMIPDVVDYETYKSGLFLPGIISTTYSFIDKVVTSLAQTIVGITLAAIGFKAAFPDVNTPYSESIFWVTMFLYLGAPIIGWVCSLIAMKFYPLTMEKMVEIQEELNDRRKKSKTITTNVDESKSILTK